VLGGEAGEEAHQQLLEELQKRLKEAEEQKRQLLAEHDTLRASEAKYRIIADNTYDWEFWLDPGGLFLYSSPSCKRITGHDAAEFTSDPGLLSRIIHPADRESFKGHRHSNLREKISEEIVFRIIQPDGAIRWVAHVCQPVFDGQGKFLGVRGSNRDVTTRMQTEEQLRLSEERFRLLSESSPIGIFQTDTVGRCLYTNAQWQRIAGLTPAESLGDGWAAAIHPEDRRHVFEEWNRCVSENRDFSQVFRFRTPQGFVRWVHARAAPLYSREGRLTGYVGTDEDITERRCVEEQLRRRDAILEAVSFAATRFLMVPDWEENIAESLERLGAAAESSRAFIFEKHWGPDGTPVVSQRHEWVAQGVSPHAEGPELQGFDWRGGGFGRWEEILARHEPVFGRTRDFPEWEQHLLRRHSVKSIAIVPVFAGEDLWGFVGFDDCLSERVWAISEIEALKTAASTLGAAVFRKRAKDALHESRRMLQLVLDTIPVRVFWKDRDGVYLGCNRLVLEDAGISSQEEIIGRNDYDLTWRDQADLYRADDRLVMETGESKLAYEEPQTTPEGRQIWLRTFKVPLRNERGDVIGVLGTYEDITERKQSEERQAQLIAELEGANRELDEFAYIVSHDLKAPLRAIASLADWILTDHADRLDSAGREKMGLLISKVKQLHGLIDAVLQYSRTLRSKEEAVEVNIGEIVRQTVEMLSPPPHMRVSIQEDLPMIRCERTRIRQVFQNLIGNAIKFADKPEGLIEVSCASEGNHWRFGVTDNGPGIEARHFSRIFQPFQTLHTRDEERGFGIGLALVKKIVEMYGGTVWVESVPGAGSTFYFTLPKEG
jgi:PAS domain S-box-containing protein